MGQGKGAGVRGAQKEPGQWQLREERAMGAAFRGVCARRVEGQFRGGGGKSEANRRGRVGLNSRTPIDEQGP